VARGGNPGRRRPSGFTLAFGDSRSDWGLTLESIHAEAALDPRDTFGGARPRRSAQAYLAGLHSA
ncbi:MAG: hypothetical protein WBN70_10505, partial [Polyangiales bacterium]